MKVANISHHSLHTGLETKQNKPTSGCECLRLHGCLFIDQQIVDYNFF